MLKRLQKGATADQGEQAFTGGNGLLPPPLPDGMSIAPSLGVIHALSKVEPTP
jgi:hypothetical protein